jgi:peptidoglycan/xylan/chitin deacetylase (PgdA/CDA1 family)
MRAISLGYHDVCDQAQSANRPPQLTMRYTLSPPDFQKHLASIHRLVPGTRVTTVGRFRQWERQIPVFLTFDDGAQSVHSYVVDELERYGWRGHFFITTDWIGRPGFLDRQQIRELHNRNHVVGSHSCSHPARMSRLSWQELVKEWSESCAILSDILGEQVKAASVPDGYYSRNVGKAAAAAGIETLFTSEATAVAAVLDGCLIMGRYFIQNHTPAAVSGAIAAGHIWPRYQQTALWQTKKLVKSVTGKSYFAIRQYLLSRTA